MIQWIISSDERRELGRAAGRSFRKFSNAAKVRRAQYKPKDAENFVTAYCPRSILTCLHPCNATSRNYLR
jgi:hypothetical protein